MRSTWIPRMRSEFLPVPGIRFGWGAHLHVQTEKPPHHHRLGRNAWSHARCRAASQAFRKQNLGRGSTASLLGTCVANKSQTRGSQISPVDPSFATTICVLAFEKPPHHHRPGREAGFHARCRAASQSFRKQILGNALPQIACPTVKFASHS